MLHIFMYENKYLDKDDVIPKFLPNCIEQKIHFFMFFLYLHNLMLHIFMYQNK